MLISSACFVQRWLLKWVVHIQNRWKLTFHQFENPYVRYDMEFMLGNDQWTYRSTTDPTVCATWFPYKHLILRRHSHSNDTFSFARHIISCLACLREGANALSSTHHTAAHHHTAKAAPASSVGSRCDIHCDIHCQRIAIVIEIENDSHNYVYAIRR